MFTEGSESASDVFDFENEKSDCERITTQTKDYVTEHVRILPTY